MASRLKEWARAIKRDVHALYLASRDPRVPWYAKALAVAVAGYALSPIDLIPDFIPVVGYLDDLIIVPLGVMLVVRLIPPDIMAEHRELAAAAQERPISRTAAIIVVCVWIASIVLVGWLAYRYFWRPRLRARLLGMDHEIASAAMQRLLRINKSVLSELAQRGIMKHGSKRGSYKLQASVRGYCQHLREEAAGRGATFSASHAISPWLPLARAGVSSARPWSAASPFRPEPLRRPCAAYA